MMDNQLNLMSYFPPYLQEFKSLQEIVTAESVIINDINLEIKKILENQFITTCDEIGIKYFERILNIIPTINDDLQTRILRVLLKWNDFPPYTINYLRTVLNNLFGEKNYELTDDFNNYTFKIEFLNNFLPTEMFILKEFIENIKPANLVYDILAKSKNYININTGFMMLGNYKKSKIDFYSYDNEFNILSNINLSANYIKEVINIE